IHLPILSQLFSSNNITSSQTDVVMLLTPHIIRTSEINENDLKPIYIGSQQNLGVGGPPPLIGGVPEPEPATAGGGAPPPPGAPPACTGRTAAGHRDSSRRGERRRSPWQLAGARNGRGATRTARGTAASA